VQGHRSALLPLHKGLDAVGRIAAGSTQVSSPASRMAQMGIDGVLNIAADRKKGAPPFQSGFNRVRIN
jgi:hypothetical protein